MDFLQNLVDTVQQLVESAGYFGLFLGALLETIFPPLPSEVIMPFGGFLVGRGELGFVGVVIAGTAGAVVGAIPIYYIGVWADQAVVRRLIRRHGRWLGVSEAGLDRALQAFDKHGGLIVFLGRLLPTVRTLISIPAGMERMPMGKFLLYTTAGTAIWTALLTYAGVVLGENWEQVILVLEPYKNILLMVVGVVLVLVVVFLVIRRIRAGNAARPVVDEIDQERRT